MRRLLCTTVLLLLTATAPAGAATVTDPAVPTVLQDDAVFLHGTDAEVRDALDRAVALGVRRIRLTADWSAIAPGPQDADDPPDFDARDPDAYPDGVWNPLDRALRLVADVGLEPMVDIGFWAPRWATAPQERDPARLRTSVDPVRFAAFAAAIARRYDGGFRPRATTPPEPPRPAEDRGSLARLLGGPRDAGPAAAVPPSPPLPRVGLYTLWNEPNHPGFLLPQWAERDGRLVPSSPGHYRAMVRAAYPAVKAIVPDATVLVGGTSSMGSSVPGRSGVPPLRFLRELACVDERLQPVTDGDCAGFTPVPGDGWSHHPYSLRTRPSARPTDPDLAPVARTPELQATLTELARTGRIAPAMAELHLTEYGYETNAPDPEAWVSPAEQARVLAWAEWLGTRVPGVRSWPQFLLQDRPGGPAGPRLRAFGDWQTGLHFADGTAKPAAASFATPVYARCAWSQGRRWTMVWGRDRRSAAGVTVTVQRAARGGLRTVPARDRPRRADPAQSQALTREPGQALTRWVPWNGAAVRLVWTGPIGTVTSPQVRPDVCAPRVSAARRSRSTRSRG